MSELARIFDRLLAPHKQRVREAVGLAILDLLQPYTGLLRAQVEVLGEVPRTGNVMQNYGFASVPLNGAQGVKLAVGGNANHVVTVAMDDGRYRPQDLSPGESCLYTDEGDRIWFKRGRIIAVTAGTSITVTAPQVTVHASTKVTLDTPLTETTGNLKVDGTINVALGATFQANVHIEGAANVDGNINGGGSVSDSNGTLQAFRVAYNAARYTIPSVGTTGTTDHPA